jgi:hypothetical protein
VRYGARCGERKRSALSTAFVRALTGVFFVVGGSAALEAAFLALWGGEANTLGRHWAWACNTFSFSTKFFGHDTDSIERKRRRLSPLLGAAAQVTAALAASS